MQKFNKGDHVRVAKDLGPSMSHFDSDCEAIVKYSYKQKYGGGKREQKEYCIYIKGKGSVSWYEEHQLELIEADRKDLLKQWKKEAKAKSRQQSDLDWIFSNGQAVLEGASGATVEALAKCFGLTNLWGSRGEGFTYYANAMATLEMARPFLEAGDKEGWLNHCKTIEV